MAVWRISAMLVYEAGPRHIFERIRTRIGIEHDMDGNPYSHADGFLPELFSCVWCMSVWVAIFMMVSILINQYAAFVFAITLSFSTGAIMIDTWIKRKQ
jgi:hypothetical protein